MIGEIIWEPFVFTPPVLAVWIALIALAFRLSKPPKRTLRSRLRRRLRRSALVRRIRRAVHYDLALVLCGLLVGVVAALVSSHHVAPPHVGVEFFATVAQVLPIFLVAFAIEQRLIDRLGMDEDEYAGEASDLFSETIRARMASEEGNEAEANRLGRRVAARPEFRWLWTYTEDALYGDPHDPPDIESLARGEYERRRRGQAVFVLVALLLVVVGEAAAVGGLILGGAARDCAYFLVSVGSFAAAGVMITFAPAPDLFRALLPTKP